jgi:hypothetical protein
MLIGGWDKGAMPRRSFEKADRMYSDGRGYAGGWRSSNFDLSDCRGWMHHQPPITRDLWSLVLNRRGTEIR